MSVLELFVNPSFLDAALASDELRQILQDYANRGIKGYEANRKQLDIDHPGRFPMRYGDLVDALACAELTLTLKENNISQAFWRARNYHHLETGSKSDGGRRYQVVYDEVRNDHHQRRGPAFMQETLQRGGTHIPM